MSAKIRKLTLSYPFKIEDRQQRSVFSLDEGNRAGNGLKVSAIVENFDDYQKKMFYRICVDVDGHTKQWKDIYPEGCTVEIEYFVS